jgi:hypothetical protein
MYLILGGIKMKWIIVGFEHPNKTKSLIYRQNVSDEKLGEVIKQGIEKGCNLFSIRGFNP